MQICRFDDHRLGVVEGDVVRDVCLVLLHPARRRRDHDKNTWGVGPIKPRDVIDASISGIGAMRVQVARG